MDLKKAEQTAEDKRKLKHPRKTMNLRRKLKKKALRFKVKISLFVTVVTTNKQIQTQLFVFRLMLHSKAATCWGDLERKGKTSQPVILYV